MSKWIITAIGVQGVQGAPAGHGANNTNIISMGIQRAQDDQCAAGDQFAANINNKNITTIGVQGDISDIFNLWLGCLHPQYTKCQWLDISRDRRFNDWKFDVIAVISHVDISIIDLIFTFASRQHCTRLNS